MGIPASVKNKVKSFGRSWKNLVDDISWWGILFLAAGGIGSVISGLIIQSTGFLIVSYIFFLVGLAFCYKKHPFGALFGSLLVIFLAVITLTISYQQELDILTDGIILILVVIIGWYVKNMDTQIRIMNNEKFGRVVAEISKVIISPLADELMHIKREFESNLFIDQIFPTHLKKEERKRTILQDYFAGEVWIHSKNNPLISVRSSARRLMQVNDPFLPPAQKQLERINVDYIRNLNDLKSLFKKFDDDFLPCFPSFKEKCIEVSARSGDPIPTDDNYFKLVLKFIFTQQPASVKNCGKEFECYAQPRYLGFIDDHKGELLEWVQNIVVLKNDLTDIEAKKLEIISCLKQMLRAVYQLQRHWKNTYYLTEEDLH